VRTSLWSPTKTNGISFVVFCAFLIFRTGIAEQLLFTIGLGGESSVVTSSAKITGTVSGVQLAHAYGERISHLEKQVATRQAEVAELKQQMAEFKKSLNRRKSHH
jgi:hypothetical protein